MTNQIVLPIIIINQQLIMYLDKTQLQGHHLEDNKYMDCHSHLLDYPTQSEMQQVIDNSLNLGVKNIVVNTTTTNQFNAMAKLLEKYPNSIVAGFGVHPCFLSIQQSIQQQKKQESENTNHQTQNNTLPWLSLLQSTLKKKQQYTVGQIGLDFRKNILQLNPKQLQMNYFKSQLNMAIKLGRPATIHCVRAHGQMLKILKDLNKGAQTQQKPHLIMHSYGGSSDITRSMLKLNNLNIYFSLSLKRSVDLCSVIPVERLICETDSPCQNNLQLLEEENRIGFNKYYLKLKQVMSSRKQMKQQGDSKTELDIKQVQTNQPANIITNIKSLVKHYKMEEGKFTKIIYENSLKAFKLIK